MGNLDGPVHAAISDAEAHPRQVVSYASQPGPDPDKRDDGIDVGGGGGASGGGSTGD